MGVAGDHTWLCRAISAQKPTFWSQMSKNRTHYLLACLKVPWMEAVTWLAGWGGLRSGTGRASPAGLGWEAGGAWGEGGWGLAGSSGEVLSAVLINYLPATGLLAALGCLPANMLSHAWWGLWARVGSRRPSLENGASTWRARQLNSSLPHMGASLQAIHAGYSCTLLIALPSWTLALGWRGEGLIQLEDSELCGNRETWALGTDRQLASGF